jgi:choice-of-anchor A domain-containing protein
LVDDFGFQASFSAAFSFRIQNSGGIGDEDGVGADGITFALTTYSNSYGQVGDGIGYSGLPQSIAIEFDTYNNGYPIDINGNHVGIDINGNIQSSTSAAYPTRMNDGNVHWAWVDYDGDTQTLSVRIADDSTRPIDSFLSANINLVNIFGNPNCFVGFTSGTGSGDGDHQILDFTFVNTYKPIGQVTTGVPAFTTGAVTTGWSTTGAILVDSCPVFDVDCNGNQFVAGAESLSFLDYDVISFGDFNGNTGDIQGRLAVQGNVNLNAGFSIGASLTDNSWYTLVAGGNVNWADGALDPEGSQAYVGGVFTSNDQYLAAQQAPYTGNLDAAFANSQACYTAESNLLATVSDNVDQLIVYGALTLTCQNPNAKTYYVTVDGSTISSINDWQPVGCGGNSEWIVNVVGTTDVTFSGNNFPSDGVVYNIVGARTINVQTSVAGSILAPAAILNQTGGTIYGKVVVASVASALQINIADCPGLANGINH